MKAAELAAMTGVRRVSAVPYQKPGFDLRGFQCRIIQHGIVKTLDPVFETEAEAIEYAEGR